MGDLRSRVALICYYGFAQFLPMSHRPGGRIFRWVRGSLARTVLAGAGKALNIESRVDFGRGGSVRIGNHSGIGPRGRVEAAVIGDGVIIGPDVLLLARNHRFTDPNTWIGRQGATGIEPVSIGEGAWLGARVTVLPGVSIGRFAVIGAGAVVTKDVPDYGVAVGNPARVIKIWSSRQN